MATQTPNLFDKTPDDSKAAKAQALGQAKADERAAKAQPAPKPAKPAPAPKPATAKAKPKPATKRTAVAKVIKRDPAASTALAIDDPVARAKAIDAMPPAVSMFQVIGRAAIDERVNPEKMKMLLDIQERIEDRANKAEFERDFVKMQMDLPTIKKGGVIEIREKDRTTGERTGKVIQATKFVKWTDLQKVIKPILHEHNFGYRTRTETAPDGKLRVYAILIHANGHREETYLDLMHDTGGSKNPVQAVGSSNSYGKRYGARNLLNIIDEDEVDDDGAKGGGTGTVDDVQQAELRRLMEEAGLSLPKFCQGLNIEGLALLPDKRYGEAKDRIAQFAAASGKKAR